MKALCVPVVLGLAFFTLQSSHVPVDPPAVEPLYPENAQEENSD